MSLQSLSRIFKLTQRFKSIVLFAVDTHYSSCRNFQRQKYTWEGNPWSQRKSRNERCESSYDPFKLTTLHPLGFQVKNKLHYYITL